MSLHPTHIELSPEQLRRLNAIATREGKSHSQVIDEMLTQTNSDENGQSVLAPEEKTLFDVLTERGILGAFDGPTDLSTNPKHLEGFGRRRDRNE